MSVRRATTVVAALSALILGSASVALADPGDVDTGFGTSGRATVDLTGTDRVAGMDRQSTGRIVVAGDGSGNAMQVFRLLPGGAPDTGFGTGGSSTLASSASSSFTATDMAIQGNDRIVVTGWEEAVSGRDQFVVGRFRAGGAPDSDFGTGGIKRVGFSQADAFSYGVAVQPNGRIVVVGEVDPVSTSISKIALIRLLPGGGLDTSFGNGGRRLVKLPDSVAGFDGAWRVRIMGDGRIVLAGWNEVAGDFYRTVVVRLRPSAAFDTTFSGDGIAVFDARPGFDDWAYALELAGGKIVLGLAGVSGEATVARLTSSGVRDTAFSGNGVATFLVSGFYASDVAVWPDGKIVVGENSSGTGKILRIRPGGGRDSAFGVNGVTSDPAGPDAIEAIELQGGKILVAGDAAGVSYVSRFLG